MPIQPNLFSEILKDNQSGSSEVLSHLIHILKNIYNEGIYEQIELESLVGMLDEIADKHRQLLIVQHFIGAFIHTVKNDEKPEAVIDFIVQYQMKWKHSFESVANYLDQELPEAGNILLHSQSGLVKETLKRKQKISGVDNYVLWQTESRPVCEGRQQASFLIKCGYKLNFITDAACGLIITKMNVVIFGADQLHPDGFVNKIGSRMIASVAKNEEIPVFVLADSRKKTTNADLALNKEIHPPEEVWADAPSPVKVHNHYFEKISWQYVTRVITEKGSFSPSDFTSQF